MTAALILLAHTVTDSAKARLSISNTVCHDTLHAHKTSKFHYPDCIAHLAKREDEARTRAWPSGKVSSVKNCVPRANLVASSFNDVFGPISESKDWVEAWLLSMLSDAGLSASGNTSVFVILVGHATKPATKQY
jgi:hypothetical protein